MAQASDEEDGGLIGGINVTPLVDITLVLLIIMMVTAKVMMASALSLDLPRADSRPNQVSMTLTIDIRADGAVLVDRSPVSADAEIKSLAEAALARDAGLRAVIHADRKVSHGRVIAVLDRLKAANVQRIAFGATP